MSNSGTNENVKPRSLDSSYSMGIGDGTLQSTKSSITGAWSDLPSLLPEGVFVLTEPIYDCIVYLIYCPQHDKIAVNNIEKCKCIWLPFVVLPDGVTWERASHDGVAVLIGRNDAEMSAEEAVKTAPIYTMTYLHILHIQLPSNRTVLRLTRFVYLQRNPHFQCCRNTDRVNWLDYADISNRNVTHRSWGPELEIFPRMTWSEPTSVISEFTTKNALFYLQLEKSCEQKLLFEAKLSEQQVLEIYSDYVEHCYPSFYMCFESFRVYMIKYGHPRDENRLFNLYNAFRANFRPFVDFHEFLVGIVILEPDCSSKLDARVQLIFRNYDFEQQGKLNAHGVIALLKDGYPSWPDSAISTEAQRLLHNKSHLSYDDFTELIRPELENNLNDLCRSPKSILKQITATRLNKQKNHGATTDGTLIARRKTKGTCWACRAQQYEYANHFVMINTDGRCVDPIIVSANKNSNIQPLNNSTTTTPMTRSQYSLEYVFTIGSMPIIFIDMIRDFHQKRTLTTSSNTAQPGLMTLPEDQSAFVKYVGILCKEMNAMLAYEEKLIKINAPALVIGDLQGNLDDLLQLERVFFQSFPAITENLVFLGNYTCSLADQPTSCGIECLIYLFSLKLCSPNKVFLLRGSNEVNTSSLGKECVRKYGSVYGKRVHAALVDIFQKLPIALLIDDQILCVHSGIPSSTNNNRLDRLMSKLPKEIKSIERECPIAYEIINRKPKIVLNENIGKLSPKTKTIVNKSNEKDGKQEQLSIETTKANRGSDSLDSIISFEVICSSFEGKIFKRINRTNSSLIQMNTFQFKRPKSPKKVFVSKGINRNNKQQQQQQQTPNTNVIEPEKSQTTNSSANKPKQVRKAPFTRSELVQFMRLNGYSHLIRSHSFCENVGYRLDFNNQCATIFSCSNYDDHNNQASVALIDGSECSIRFISCDTSCTN
ncbi:hypothetical protein RDWZM_009750 [Blomia tropicalis]|uniref:Serine/threonine specific protein phosphatases domain-containing protein n=1 Tax=Blomia tropicalis TaxID=40697 RepID=A0A9Q0M4L2_BLOTA|nr:hypothetical protein RDWZM_009750 [Blomia tropicalis]